MILFFVLFLSELSFNSTGIVHAKASCAPAALPPVGLPCLHEKGKADMHAPRSGEGRRLVSPPGELACARFTACCCGHVRHLIFRTIPCENPSINTFEGRCVQMAKDDTPPNGTERVAHSACGGKGYINDFGNKLPCRDCGGTGKVLILKS